jgi:hypothetical protein
VFGGRCSVGRIKQKEAGQEGCNSRVLRSAALVSERLMSASVGAVCEVGGDWLAMGL